jgi:hypothetical protein
MWIPHTLAGRLERSETSAIQTSYVPCFPRRYRTQPDFKNLSLVSQQWSDVGGAGVKRDPERLSPPSSLGQDKYLGDVGPSVHPESMYITHVLENLGCRISHIGLFPSVTTEMGDDLAPDVQVLPTTTIPALLFPFTTTDIVSCLSLQSLSPPLSVQPCCHVHVDGPL